jgi:hypothetical protein
VRAARRLLLLTCGFLASAGFGAAAATATTRYYVTFKISGSFSHTVLGMSSVGFDETDAAKWSYRERFGPVDLAKSARRARTSKPKVSGSWSTSLVYGASNGPSDCSQAGRFDSGGARLSMVGAAGFRSAAISLSAGQQGLGGYPSQNCDDAQQFFGAPDNLGATCNAGSGSIREALRRAGGACSKATYFTVHLGVSRRGLSAHHFTYKVSSARPYAEKVSPGCNQQDNPSMGYTIGCMYSWSGTVTFLPAG